MFEVENDIRSRFEKWWLTDSNGMHHVWHWFTSESPDSKRPLTCWEYRSFLQDRPCWLVDVFAIVLCWMLKVPPASNMKDTEWKVYLKKYSTMLRCWWFLNPYVFLPKGCIHLKSFVKGSSATCFLGFHVSPFSGGLKVLGWSGSQQEMADLGGFDVVAGCQGMGGPRAVKDPPFLQRGFGTQLNTHVIYSPEN